MYSLGPSYRCDSIQEMTQNRPEPWHINDMKIKNILSTQKEGEENIYDRIFREELK